MERILTWRVATEAEGETLEQFLRSRGCSHHVLTHLKRTAMGILYNGHRAYTSQKLKEGDVIEIHIIETESSEHILPVALPLVIVYEDDDILIVNKPSDMPIHPSINNYENTLANAVMQYYQKLGTPFVYRCINRLDRDTSGLLIIAKNMFSGAILSQMSARHEIHREYLAILDGILPGSGTVDAPIARLEGSAIMRCIDREKGDRAITHFTRLQTTASGLSLASIQLETGRTHQIRVHMKHLGYPLIGDFLYHPASMHLIGRQALHSHCLSFRHPVTGESLTFTCALPDDMKRVLSDSKYSAQPNLAADCLCK